MRCIGALLVSIAIIGGLPDAAHGCTCLYYAAPVCFVYADSEAVFIGKVRQIKKTDGYDRVRIDVIEAFKGVHTRSVEITSGDLSCDFEGFVRGQSYLVFAYKHKQDGAMRC